MGPTTDTNSTDAQPRLIKAWVASGDPRRDLPSWTRAFDDGEATLASRSVPAQELFGERLAEAARDAILAALSELPVGPCRIWAFLPRPTERDDDFLERYMRFNEGRTNAYRSLSDQLTAVPAGTCVGHAGALLVIHALALRTPFVTVENPRQRPAWLYSRKFGPVPPAFVRGTTTHRILMASGTAAVVGEDTVHDASIDLQFQEAIHNLQSLAEAAGAAGAWRSLQIYVREAADLDRVRELAAARFGGGVERILQAPLCRGELLVEIEGICDVLAAHP
ncbi:MAG: hypothetical protein K8R92_09865 [Planctomycetes bacterium]|nr:hypothetical protein [Planctomycetota bacterium]